MTYYVQGNQVGVKIFSNTNISNSKRKFYM